MALYVSDADAPGKNRIRFDLQNSTEIEIVFLIGEESFTLKPGQSKRVRSGREISIEARPMIIGVESGFLVGGVKSDCAIHCSLETSSDGSESLRLTRF